MAVRERLGCPLAAALDRAQTRRGCALSDTQIGPRLTEGTGVPNPLFDRRPTLGCPVCSEVNRRPQHPSKAAAGATGRGA